LPFAGFYVPRPLDADLPDFASIDDIHLKKQTFFDFLQPYVDAKNAEVRQQRRRLQLLVTKIKSGSTLRQHENVFLWELARNYQLKTDDLYDPVFLERLLHRVDVLPPSLVLAQAANESAWGTSRFAQEGYNFFGQWCYTEGCGFVPVRRRANASHEVKSFSSIEEAVNAYFLNINTFPSYQDLRLIRQALRQDAKPIDGISLAKGLREYSERGDAYINELQNMIYKNNLLARDKTLYP
jgi:Bax protein